METFLAGDFLGEGDLCTGLGTLFRRILAGEEIGVEEVLGGGTGGDLAYQNGKKNEWQVSSKSTCRGNFSHNAFPLLSSSFNAQSITLMSFPVFSLTHPAFPFHLKNQTLKRNT